MISRRRFLQAAGSTALLATGVGGTAVRLARAQDAVPAGVVFDPAPFMLGVASGDPHFHQVHDLRPDFDDPLSTVVASELVGASISSSGFPPGSNPAVAVGLRAANDTMRWFEGERRGYAVCDVTPERWRTEFRTVDDPMDPRSPVGTFAAFEIARGVAGAVQVEGPDIPPPA